MKKKMEKQFFWMIFVVALIAGVAIAMSVSNSMTGNAFLSFSKTPVATSTTSTCSFSSELEGMPVEAKEFTSARTTLITYRDQLTKTTNVLIPLEDEKVIASEDGKNIYILSYRSGSSGTINTKVAAGLFSSETLICGCNATMGSCGWSSVNGLWKCSGSCAGGCHVMSGQTM